MPSSSTVCPTANDCLSCTSMHSLLPQLRPSAAAYLCHPVDGLPVALSQNLRCLQVPLLRAQRARATLLCALEPSHRAYTAPAPACGSSRRSTASSVLLSGQSGWRPARAPLTPPRSCLRRAEVFAAISPYTAHTSASSRKHMQLYPQLYTRVLAEDPRMRTSTIRTCLHQVVRNRQPRYARPDNADVG